MLLQKVSILMLLMRDVTKGELFSARLGKMQSIPPPRRVIRSATAKISTVAATELPKYETLARNVRRIRQNANVTPQLPQTLDALKIDGEFAITVKLEPFVLFDNKDAENRIVMFATRNNLNFMVLCDDLYMDGTFDITPPLFKQVYTIHGRKNNKYFPLVYVLACKKDFYTYETVLRQLKLADPRLKPKAIMGDFEMAAIKAAHEVFPMPTYTANGLQTIYQEDSTFAMYIRCLAALAFVPVDDVLKRFNEKLSGTTSIDIGVQKLFEYMETNWIGTKPRRTYTPEKFAIDLWNVYELTLECFPRTNNTVEGWHNAIAALFGVHPNIFKFICGMKLEQDATEVLISKMFSGIDVSSAINKRNEKVSERILNVVKTYGDVNDAFEFKNYLCGLSQAIHFGTK
ncbi:hypothetical protein HA402_011988 [Bradysia odoriphaga]|nr:hypothetical protein HA402_011988 [Bradysia odoriphaga]